MGTAVAEKSKFAVRLKELREAAKLSQAELAAQVGLTKFTIAKMEQDLRKPSWKSLQAIAKALNVAASALVEE